MKVPIEQSKIISILGGGSVWTPYLMQLLAELPIRLEVRLQGPTEHNLLQVASFADQLVGDRLKIVVAPELKEAVTGASIVLNQARIGGWAARSGDESLPVRIGLIGDESLGLGGLRAAVRSRQHIIESAGVIAEQAPDAWLLNLSNPCDLLSRAWREAGCSRVLGLCDHPQSVIRDIAFRAGRPEAFSDFGFIGINHVGWVILPRELDVQAILGERSDLRQWIHDWEAIPTRWRAILSDQTPLLRRQQQDPGSRASELMSLAAALREQIRRRDAERYKSLLTKRPPDWYSAVVVPAIRALLGDRPARIIAGAPNAGRLPEVDPDIQIEGWVSIRANQIQAEPFPYNKACRADIVHFGKARAAAFAAMRLLERNSIQSWLASDPFVRSLLSLESEAILKTVKEYLANQTAENDTPR